jgi:hypothetical protein
MKKGMNWDNIEIDHKKPVSKFDLKIEDEFFNCFHFTNCQPLLREDNRKKFTKWTEVDEKNWQPSILVIEF